ITAAAIIPGEVDEAVAVVVDTIVALVYGGVSVGDPGVLDPQPGGAEGIANAGADAGGHAPLQADDAVFEGNLTRHEAKLDEPVVVGHHRAVGAHGLDVEGHGAGDLPTTGWDLAVAVVAKVDREWQRRGVAAERCVRAEGHTEA